MEILNSKINVKDRHVGLRVTKNEHEKLRVESKKLGKSIADLIREGFLNNRSFIDNRSFN